MSSSVEESGISRSVSSPSSVVEEDTSSSPESSLPVALSAASDGWVLVGIALDVNARFAGVDELTTGNGPVSSRPVKRAVSISASSSSIVVSDTECPAVSAAARASDIEMRSSSVISSNARRTVSCDAIRRSRPARSCSICRRAAVRRLAKSSRIWRRVISASRIIRSASWPASSRDTEDSDCSASASRCAAATMLAAASFASASRSERSVSASVRIVCASASAAIERSACSSSAAARISSASASASAIRSDAAARASSSTRAACWPSCAVNASSSSSAAGAASVGSGILASEVCAASNSATSPSRSSSSAATVSAAERRCSRTLSGSSPPLRFVSKDAEAIWSGDRNSFTPRSYSPRSPRTVTEAL